MDVYQADEQLKQLSVIQKELAERIIPDCMDTYLNYTLVSLQGLLSTLNNSIFMHFRSTIENNITIIYRIKSMKSVINNISKEILKQSMEMIKENPHAFLYDENYSEIEKQRKQEELAALTKKVTENVYKDYFGATLIFNTKNDVDHFCQALMKKHSTLSHHNTKKEAVENEVIALYHQANTVSKYLNSAKETIAPKNFFNLLLKSNFIDISDTFVDKDPNPRAPRRVVPLNIGNINTPEDYFTQLINLLTLLTNISIPCLETTLQEAMPKYCICELDKPVLEVFQEALSTVKDPNRKDDVIQKFNELSDQYYFNRNHKEEFKKKPFDVQLEQALNQMQQAKKSSHYRKKLSPRAKQKCMKKLFHLQDNLKKLNKTRLLAAILKLQLPELIYKNKQYPDLDLNVTFEKERADANGFYTLSYIIDLNGFKFELHAQPEFCYKYSLNGNCAHNSTLKGKSFEISSLFELKADQNRQENEPELLKMYTTFLASIEQGAYKKYGENSPLQKKFQEYILYAISKIQLKNTFEFSPNQKAIPFVDYIASLIEYKGAKFGTISPAHRIMPNQSISTPQNALFSLEDILKSRVGVSVLANLVIAKFKMEIVEKGQNIESPLKPREYSLDTIAEDFKHDVRAVKRDKKPLSNERKPFYPQGQHPSSER